MKYLTLLFSLSLSAQALASATTSARCDLKLDSLNTEEAVGRSAWAIKCYPFLKYSATAEGKFELMDAQTSNIELGYPTFIEIGPNGEVINWVAPKDGQTSCVDPNKYVFAGYCRAGCYTPDQMLLYSDGYQEIGKAYSLLRDDIVTLSQDSTIDRIGFTVSELKAYTIDKKPQWQKIAKITTAQGGELKVTLNHPLLVSTGNIKEAWDLKVGDRLINENGQFESITAINVSDYFGRVINVEPASLDSKKNIVVAQGFLNGSGRFQNSTTDLINRMVLRSLAPDVKE